MLPVNTYFPSGEKATLLTDSVCPLKVRMLYKDGTLFRQGGVGLREVPPLEGANAQQGGSLNIPVWLGQDIFGLSRHSQPGQPG